MSNNKKPHLYLNVAFIFVKMKMLKKALNCISKAHSSVLFYKIKDLQPIDKSKII